MIPGKFNENEKTTFFQSKSMFCLFELGSTPFMYCAENKYKTVMPVRVKKKKKTGIYAYKQCRHILIRREYQQQQQLVLALHINTSFRNYDIEASK